MTITITDISFEREVIDISGSDIDPSWRFVDKNGNEHCWQKDTDGDWQLPTLERRITVLPSFDELGVREENEEFIEYYAPATGERVHPGTRYMTWHTPGMPSATVKFVSDTAPPWTGIPLSSCAFPISSGVSSEDLSGWTLFIKEWKEVGSEHYRGEGVVVRT